jgi:diguanylate cyclase (GGDEF)-like protein
MRAATFLEKHNRLLWGVIGAILVIIFGLLDYLTGYEINFALFYLIPIFLASWFAGGQMGLIISANSAIAWFIADYSTGLSYSHSSIFVWNVLIRLGFYTVVAWLSAALRKSNQANLDLARTDFITGAVSARYFYDLAQLEIGRFRRYKRPFTFVYIDIDNFKTVNDRLGHSTGDRVLRAVTEIIQRQIRPIDILARLGGDEFALLLPETEEDGARQVIFRIHRALTDEMLRNDWMLTFSVGVVTYKREPKSVDEMVRMADKVMYSIKMDKKNGVGFDVYAK